MTPIASYLIQTPGQSRTFEIYVHLSSAPTGDWQSDYSVAGYTLTASTSNSTPLDGAWYDLGSVTIASDDNTSALTVSYSGDTAPDAVCVTGYSNFSYYNSAGELSETLDRDGRATTFCYDTIGRETSENFYTTSVTTGSPVETIGWTYNTAGGMASATDENFTTSTTSINAYTYDLLGELLSDTQTIPGLTPTVTLGSAYTDANRTLLAATIGTEGSANYDFVNTYAYAGVFGQMSEVSQQTFDGPVPSGDAVDEVAPKSATFDYDLQGECTTVNRYADAIATTLVASAAYGYDAEGDMTSLAYTKSGSTLPSYTWTYDTLGDMSSATETLGTIVDADTYTSDSTGQLLSATGGPTDESFALDPNGNSANAGVVIGMNNELLFDGTYNYAYDAQGNRTARWVQSSANKTAGLLVPASGDTDITYYAWDNLNRMTGVTHYATFGGTADLQVSYNYDAFNEWIGETVTTGGVTTQTRFAYDGNQIVMQFGGTGTSALTASNLTNRYLWGPAVDQLMADEQVSGLGTPGSVLWAFTDNQNTVRDLATFNPCTGATTVVDHRVFSAYGTELSQTNPTTLDPAAVDCIMGYTGRPLDSATGLQNNLNRWYDSITSQWLAPDPSGLGPDSNPYRYCGNGPMDGTDPSGLADSMIGAAAMVAPVTAALAEAEAELPKLEEATAQLAEALSNPENTKAIADAQVKVTQAANSITNAVYRAQSLAKEISHDFPEGSYGPAVKAADGRANEILAAVSKINVTALTKVFQKFPIGSGDCVQAAKNAGAILGSQAKIVLIQGANSQKFWVLNGQTITKKGQHFVTEYGGRIYDAITGPSGMTWAEYVAYYQKNLGFAPVQVAQ